MLANFPSHMLRMRLHLHFQSALRPSVELEACSWAWHTWTSNTEWRKEPTVFTDSARKRASRLRQILLTTSSLRPLKPPISLQYSYENFFKKTPTVRNIQCSNLARPQHLHNSFSKQLPNTPSPSRDALPRSPSHKRNRTTTSRNTCTSSTRTRSCSSPSIYTTPQRDYDVTPIQPRNLVLLLNDSRRLY